MTDTREGRCWVLPDANINTDLIMPEEGKRLPRPEQLQLVFARLRPEWSSEVRDGDILIAGPNFGTGSSRPAVQLLIELGVTAIVATSIYDLFYRNCVSYGMAALECPDALSIVTEGDTVRVDLANGLLSNVSTGAEAHGRPMPEMMRDIISGGGVHAALRRQGMLA
jgi:3-isopropylmalate/(R)-2-methylmalate dehydratase small subunit